VAKEVVQVVIMQVLHLNLHQIEVIMVSVNPGLSLCSEEQEKDWEFP
jgi:hypothetical protein